MTEALARHSAASMHALFPHRSPAELLGAVEYAVGMQAPFRLVKAHEGSDPSLGTLGEAVLQALRKRVDLIVMTAHRKRQEFGAKPIEPRRVARHEDRARLDPRGVLLHANNFFALRLDGNRMDIFALQVLDQARP